MGHILSQGCETLQRFVDSEILFVLKALNRINPKYPAEPSAGSAPNPQRTQDPISACATNEGPISFHPTWYASPGDMMQTF